MEARGLAAPGKERVSGCRLGELGTRPQDDVDVVVPEALEDRVVDRCGEGREVAGLGAEDDVAALA